jgi:hypothetical protein
MGTQISVSKFTGSCKLQQGPFTKIAIFFLQKKPMFDCQNRINALMS